MAQLMTEASNARLVQLIVISEQVMADKIVRENVYNVLGIGDEFQWS